MRRPLEILNARRPVGSTCKADRRRASPYCLLATSRRTARLSNLLLVVRLNYVIQLSDVRTDTRYAATSVDIIGAVSGRDFIVFLSHLGRPVPPALRSLDGGKAGALNVCLEGLAQRFHGEERNNEALASILELFLRHDWDSRHGLFQTELRSQATRRTCGSRAQGQDGSG